MHCEGTDLHPASQRSHRVRSKADLTFLVGSASDISPRLGRCGARPRSSHPARRNRETVMDEPKLKGSHKKTPAPAGRTDFIPMTLVLQPNGLKVELTRPEMLLGRHSGADLRLPMPDVSRRHCRFVFQDGVW